MLQPVQSIDSRAIHGTLTALEQYNARFEQNMTQERYNFLLTVEEQFNLQPVVFRGAVMPLEPVVVIQSVRIKPMYFDFELDWTLVVTI